MSIASLIPLAGQLIDRVIPDKAAADKAKLELLHLQQSGDLKELDASMQVIVAEAKSEHWLTANWRPIVMLVFVALISAHWIGWTAPGLTEAEVLSLLDIVKVGLGGYVVGRSAEKVVKAHKEKS